MKTRKITKVAVIGAGTMGHSIAQVFAQNGISTSLVDRDSELLENARNLIKSNLDTLAEYGKIKHQDIPGALSRLRTTTDYGSACRDTDFVLEAVNEVPEVKQEAFSLLERYCRADTILASNTSGLDIYRLLTFQHAERVIIAHWFAPPHIIPLVEVVPGPQTEGEVVDCTARFLSDLGKRPLVMKQYVHSFIVNRLQNFITAAMWEILSNGWATVEELDYAVKAVLGIRFPVTALVQRLDFTGIDLVLDVFKDYGTSNPLVEQMVKEGRLGVKSGRGFFDYAGRTEAEVLRERDLKYLKMLDFMEENGLFKPV